MMKKKKVIVIVNGNSKVTSEIKAALEKNHEVIIAHDSGGLFEESYKGPIPIVQIESIAVPFYKKGERKPKGHNRPYKYHP